VLLADRSKILGPSAVDVKPVRRSVKPANLPNLRIHQIRDDVVDGSTSTQSGAAQSGLLRSTAAGLVAALVGAIIWMVIVMVSGYEVGIVAVGIGFMVGQAMALTAGTSTRLPPIGAVLALFGCVFGQFLTDAHFLAEAVGVSFVRAFREMVTDLGGLGWDVFSAGFSPIHLLFWAIAGYEGYVLTARAVAVRNANRQQLNQPPVADYFPPAGTPATSGTPAASGAPSVAPESNSTGTPGTPQA
jgi:hypothetical protein